MYATNKKSLLEMFLDSTAGESTLFNRLVTRDGDDGVELWAYGWLKLAVYNESDSNVTVFSGHASLRSKTINEYLNDVVRVAEARSRSVTLSGESPTVDSPNAGVEYINNYISMSGKKSAVERDTENEVIDQLRHLA